MATARRMRSQMPTDWRVCFCRTRTKRDAEVSLTGHWTWADRGGLRLPLISARRRLRQRSLQPWRPWCRRWQGVWGGLLLLVVVCNKRQVAWLGRSRGTCITDAPVSTGGLQQQQACWDWLERGGPGRSLADINWVGEPASGTLKPATPGRSSWSELLHTLPPPKKRPWTAGFLAKLGSASRLGSVVYQLAAVVHRPALYYCDRPAFWWCLLGNSRMPESVQIEPNSGDRPS